MKGQNRLQLSRQLVPFPCKNLNNPFDGNPLRNRTDWQRAVHDLFVPLKQWFSPAYARVKLGHTGTDFSQLASEVEGFARPLWGIVPLLMGGGHFEDLSLYHLGLTNGSNPHHPEYWGNVEDFDQRVAEMAPIGLALLLAPQYFWEPLSQNVQQALVKWLQQVNRVDIADNNWLFFRILVNLGLENVGAQPDKMAKIRALERLERFYLGDGWYSDGLKMQRDYYIPFAFHFYGLIYAKMAHQSDPTRSQDFRERAARFAQDYIHWFAESGSALPFGRSLSYRFAQGSFWGALAFADVEAFPWDVIKGLAMRHLRWWARQPIFNNDGTLSIGYAYPNLNIADQYISPASPYWAFKIFLPLALPDSHPFWQAEEAPLPNLPCINTQNHPGMIFCSDQTHSHVFALSSIQHAEWLRNGDAKYAKMAYSTSFGFSVPSSPLGLVEGAYDSVLALSEDNQHFRVREGPAKAHVASGLLRRQLQKRRWLWHTLQSLRQLSAQLLSNMRFPRRGRAITTLSIEHTMLYSRWQPWQDVIIETWLFPMLPWHIRIHRMHNERYLYSAEGGFALDRTESDADSTHRVYNRNGFALVVSSAGWSGLRDLTPSGSTREGLVLFTAPNTNVLYPRTVIPTLVGEHTPGEHWLLCAVLGLPDRKDYQSVWNDSPVLQPESDFHTKIVIGHQGIGKAVFL
jgi:hypothetical protein